MKKLLSFFKFQLGFTFFRKSSRPREWGFTLIELLIAVVIIVILISLGAVSYTTVNRSARDAQRKSDLNSIALALEKEFSDFGFYPAANAFGPYPNTLMSCANTGHDPSLGDDSGYRYIALVDYVNWRYVNRQLSCQDINSGAVNIYLNQTPLTR